MDDATLYIVIFGSIMVAFGIFSLYFSSESAQRKYNPEGEPRHSPRNSTKPPLRGKPKTSIIIATNYRVRQK